ncbi:MAG: glycosyltransferase [Clostridiales Family XIII bacterium]|jgi:glycosyltransferase involved in cell wall biosynthesis|nr:glycosyltransferase [Clostridiales Family XIII bacterium]
MKNGIPEISIIVPVYNGAEYLNRCIDSILQNDFDRFDAVEILLLDDGSTDESKQIMNAYADPDRNPKAAIRVISHPNMGVAATRNKGLSLANGRYILFIDQDDYFDRDYIRTFYDAIEAGDCDVVIGGHKRPNTTGKIVSRKRIIGKGYFQYINTFAWGKIHRASFIKEKHIEFFDNNIGEDVVFSVSEAGLTKKFGFIAYEGYNWFFNEASVSNSAHKGFRDDVAIIPWMEKMYSLHFETERLREYFLAKIPMYYLLHSGRTSTKEKYLETYHVLFDWIQERFPDFKKNRFLLYGLKGEALSVKVPIAVFLRIHKLKLMKLFAAVYCKAS